MSETFDAFVAALPQAQQSALGDPSVAATAVARMLARARAERPEVDVPTEAFAAHVASRLRPEAAVVEQLERVAAGDLWLAFACCRGDDRAIELLERRYEPEISGALRRLRTGPLPADDLRQVLRHHLFVGDGKSGPAIARYSGHGNLGAWLRVTSMRAVLNTSRNRPPPDAPAEDEDLFEFEPSDEDPELDYLKRVYRDAFRRAFLDTVDRLAAEDRMLLRQSVIHGLTVRELAKIHGVHHATVARRLASARQQLLTGTRAALAAQLDVGDRELDSIMGLVASRLEVSLSRALNEEGDAE